MPIVVAPHPAASAQPSASTSSGSISYQTIYRGLNHQHFCELLAEHEQLQLSVASVRRILRTAGFGSPQTRRPAPHRARRERMPAEGMLLQLDGSPHRWLGPAGPRWSLLGAVDDATGEAVAAVFRDQEDSAGYLVLPRLQKKARLLAECK